MVIHTDLYLSVFLFCKSLFFGPLLLGKSISRPKAEHPSSTSFILFSHALFSSNSILAMQEY